MERKMSVELVRKMQRIVANSSVTPSAIRGGKSAIKGVKAAATEHLCNIDLTRFADPIRFYKVLDAETAKLERALPDGARYAM